MLFLIILIVVLIVLYVIIKKSGLANETAKKKELDAQRESARLAAQESRRLHAQEMAVKCSESVPVEYHVAGTSFRQNEIASLGSENEFYTMTAKQLVKEEMTDIDIYRYDFPSSFSATLQPELDNPHDPHAVKVFLNGVMVGYIPADASEAVSGYIADHRVVDAEAKVIGGPYLNYDSYNEEFDREDDINLGVLLKLYIKSSEPEN